MKKINLKSGLTPLSDNEMKMAKGGGWLCGDGRHWDWYYSHCVTNPGTPEKQAACEGKLLGEPCSYSSNGKMESGTSLLFTANTPFCSTAFRDEEVIEEE